MLAHILFPCSNPEPILHHGLPNSLNELRGASTEGGGRARLDSSNPGPTYYNPTPTLYQPIRAAVQAPTSSQTARAEATGPPGVIERDEQILGSIWTKKQQAPELLLVDVTSKDAHPAYKAFGGTFRLVSGVYVHPFTRHCYPFLVCSMDPHLV